MFKVLNFQPLRTGSFVTEQRVRLWACALLIAYVVALAFLAATRHGLNDFEGRPLGSDFSDIYVAGQAALDGHPASPFHPAEQYRREQALFGHETPFYGWHYPPFFLLIAAPLAALPYLGALFCWEAVTLGLYLFGLRILLRRSSAPELARGYRWLLAALSFPAVFVNLTHGHNGFLTASLLAMGLAFLPRRPGISGLLFALMIYKPQFGLMIPVALAAEGRWKTIAVAGLTVILLAAITITVFGFDVWQAFFSSLAFTRTAALEEGAAGFFKLHSVFAWARMWSLPVSVGYFAQAVTVAAVGVLLFRLWRSDVSRERKGAALCLASLLATPYCFDYDMMALAPAIALMTAEGFRGGLRDHEKTALALLWLCPFFARSVAHWTMLPVGVLTMSAVFLMLTVPSRRPKAVHQNSGSLADCLKRPVAANGKPL